MNLKKPVLLKKPIKIYEKISDLPIFRKREHDKQNEICPILKIKVPFEDTVIDHKHKNKKDIIGVNGGGLIRGVIQRQANALEGKITNNFKRLGLNKYIKLPDFLRNLADYLENPPIKQIYIHPTEERKMGDLKKNSFKKINKLYQKKYPSRKELSYPKSGKMTKNLRVVYKEFNIKPEFNKHKKKRKNKQK